MLLSFRIISDGYFVMLQRLLKMADGLNFKDFVAFLSAFNAKATITQKIEGKCLCHTSAKRL